MTCMLASLSGNINQRSICLAVGSFGIDPTQSTDGRTAFYSQTPSVGSQRSQFTVGSFLQGHHITSSLPNVNS